MEIVVIKNTPSSPDVELNPKTGVFSFSGRSLPEDPFEFYGPVLDWFEEYKEKPISGARFDFKLTYFNTASSKVFFSIFQTIDNINLKHPGVENKIVIYANNDDDDLLELFEYYQELLTSDCLELKSF